MRADSKVLAPLGVDGAGDVGIIEIPGYERASVVLVPARVIVDLRDLTDGQRTLREACPVYARCMKRWAITLLRHKEGGDGVSLYPYEIVRLDGWRT